YGGQSLPLICSWPLAPGQNKRGRTETFRCLQAAELVIWRHALAAQRVRTFFNLQCRFAIGPPTSVGPVERNASRLPVANSAIRMPPHTTVQKVIILTSDR